MSSQTDGSGNDGALSPVLGALAWLWVAVPFVYGLFFLLLRIPALFSS